MKRRLFLKRLRDALLLLQGGRVLGAPATEPPKVERAVNGKALIKLLLTGDVMTGRGIDQILGHPSVPTLYESYVRDARRYVALAEDRNGPIPNPVDDRYLWGEALDVWESERPDLRIVNLETSVTASEDAWPAKGIHYRMHPDNISCLTAAGIDCCVLANNHVLDWGHAGLAETLETLTESAIAAAGAGRDADEAGRPARLEIAGKTGVLLFAFADASSGVPASWRATKDRGGVNLLKNLSVDTARQAARHILSHKSDEDITVASIHWGGNWGYGVPASQQRFAHTLIDEGGVDIVHGHSSHHATAIEIYQGKPIFYGCGDFMNDYEGIRGEERYRPWLASMYFVTLAVPSRAIEAIEIITMQLKRFRLIQATRQDRQWLMKTLRDVSKDFGTTYRAKGDGMTVGPLPDAIQE